MTVETFDPSQTTTLETPVKSLTAQAQANGSGAKIGFVSLGWLRA